MPASPRLSRRKCGFKAQPVIPGSRIGGYVRTHVLTQQIERHILSWSRPAMRFEWDEQKNRQNLRKHDVRFETAMLVFDDPYGLTQRDFTFEDEERWITVGAIGAGFDSIGRACFL
jgi:Ribonuclease toxin, BrnT, of type II toxin-antitoxin system